eukprot:8461697-Ditylum_brightwellii.AAC.1
MKAKEGLREVKALWFKAHQDYTKPLGKLTLDARLHILADANVNAFRMKTSPHLSPVQTPTVFPSNHAYITVNDIITTCNLQQFLWENYSGSNLDAYIR